jgi:hypothetical protein
VTRLLDRAAVLAVYGIAALVWIAFWYGVAAFLWWIFFQLK